MLTNEEMKALEELYNTKTKPECKHARAEVTLDDGIYYFHCPSCGRRGMGDQKAALALGWIEAGG